MILRAIGLALAAIMVANSARADYLSRPFADDSLYFIVLDRFARDEPSDAGLADVDPRQVRYFHGGTIAAATRKLDYIQGLGVTAIWLTPIFVNQTSAQDPRANRNSTAYHGYSILDFLHIDPHFGTDADLHHLIDEAHRRDIKIFLDIVVNHTADVIRYRECPLAHPIGIAADRHCPYRDKADYPPTRRASDGAAINQGFQGDDPPHQTEENYARLTDMNFAYSPYIPPGREHAKNPDWLNDLRLYHNRGDTNFRGESALNGDFGGMDDVYTENPRVVAGFIDIYRSWIEKFHIDGYRIDTVRHVNVEFWQSFIPAILDFAHSQGIPNFFIFGEVADFKDDSVQLARFTQSAKLPATLDFAFFDLAGRFASGAGDSSDFAKIFAADELYAGGSMGAANSPIFVSNHDNGRLAYLIRKAFPRMDAAELMQRVMLGHAAMYFARGVPVTYYGDEQGFVGTADDAFARQDMFPTLVPGFLAEEKLGPQPAPDRDHFNPDHPLYRAFAEMGRLRQQHDGLRHGSFLWRPAPAAKSLVIFSRIDRQGGEEFIVALNNSLSPQDAKIETLPGAADWQSLHGACRPQQEVALSYEIAVPPLGYVVCRHKIGSPP